MKSTPLQGASEIDLAGAFRIVLGRGAYKRLAAEAQVSPETVKKWFSGQWPAARKRQLGELLIRHIDCQQNTLTEIRKAFGGPAMFANSRMALAVYDSTQARRDAALDSARTAAEMAAWTCNEAEALRAVRLAFYEDTKEFNSLAHCMMARLSFIRDCVQAS